MKVFFKQLIHDKRVGRLAQIEELKEKLPLDLKGFRYKLRKERVLLFSVIFIVIVIGVCLCVWL